MHFFYFFVYSHYTCVIVVSTAIDKHVWTLVCVLTFAVTVVCLVLAAVLVSLFPIFRVLL